MKAQGADKKDTRGAIAELFCEQVRASSLDKIRVGELIKELGINRNTFYYYFASKNDVAIYAFRKDMDERLRRVYPASELVTQFSDDDPFASLAYYGRTETGARTLDSSRFTTCLMQCISEDKALYRNLFTWREIDYVQYMRALWRKAVAEDIETILDGRYMADETKDMLAGYGSNTIIGIAFFAVDKADKLDLFCDERINPFNNLVLESIQDAIKRHPLNRVARNSAFQSGRNQLFNSPIFRM